MPEPSLCTSESELLLDTSLVQQSLVLSVSITHSQINALHAHGCPHHSHHTQAAHLRLWGVIESSVHLQGYLHTRQH